MIFAAQLVAMVAGGVNGEPGWGLNGQAGFVCFWLGRGETMRHGCLKRSSMHAVVRKYTGSPYVAEVRPKLRWPLWI